MEAFVLRLDQGKAAIKHPVSAVRFKLGNKIPLQKKLLLKAFQALQFKHLSLADFETYWNEIKNNELLPHLHQELKAGNGLSSTFGKWLYISIRALKPDSMIETGVANGFSSWVILNAMHKNGKGKLYSIDLPGNDTNADYNLPSEQIGRVVPEILRSNWSLRLGDGKQLLPALMQELGQIDVFFHDSDHSYEHMKFEFEQSFPYIRSGGLILSDDIHKNNSFEEFYLREKLPTVLFSKGGCCRKP